MQKNNIVFTVHKLFIRRKRIWHLLHSQDNPVTLIGNEVKVGDKAPNFTVLANDLSPVTLADTKGTVRLISVVPSLRYRCL